MKTLIVGCGYLGTALGKLLKASGGEVWALRRDLGALKALETLGFNLVLADLLDSTTLEDLPKADAAVLCQAPSRKTDDYKGTYLEGTYNLLKAFSKHPPKKLLFVSSTSVYGVRGGSWVDEVTDPARDGYESQEAETGARILLEAEKLVLAGGIPSIVFRLGGIYGPRRNRIQWLREGKFKPVFSEAFVNRIHVDDAAAGIELLLHEGKPGEIYLGVDDRPSTHKEFYAWLCRELSLPPPAGESSGEFHKRCSNAKLKKLGMAFKFPSYQEGYSALLEKERA